MHAHFERIVCLKTLLAGYPKMHQIGILIADLRRQFSIFLSSMPIVYSKLQNRLILFNTKVPHDLQDRIVAFGSMTKRSIDPTIANITASSSCSLCTLYSTNTTLSVISTNTPCHFSPSCLCSHTKSHLLGIPSSLSEHSLPF